MTFNKTFAIFAVPALIGAALIASLLFLIVKTGSTEFDFAGMSRVIRDLKQLDTQWSVDVLRVAGGMDNNFDKVVSPLSRIRALRAHVREQTRVYASQHPESAAALAALLDKYDAAMDRKIVLVERIKSSRSIETNSSRFLPIADAQLLDAVRGDHGAGPTEAELDGALNTLLCDTMSDLFTPDPVGRERLQNDVSRVRNSLGRSSSAVNERGEILLSHVDVLLQEREIGKQLLAEEARLPTVISLDALHDQYMRNYDQELSRQHTYKQALIAYSLVVLLLLCFVGYLLYKHYRALQSSLERLKDANNEVQMRLIQSAKMGAIGQMVAGIAHEINTPVAYVKATFSMLRELLTAAQQDDNTVAFAQRLNEATPDRAATLDLVDDSDEEESPTNLLEDINSLLDDGMHGIEQIAELILTLKNFSRIDRARRADFNVHDGLNSTLVISRYMLKRTVEVKKEFQDLPSISCSPSQINQVFLNIITNAAQSMVGRDRKGLITIRTWQPSSDKVQVDIQDNGSGIHPEIMPRVFEPFFTTKSAGEGSGAGLAICLQIVRNHGGDIRIASEVGVGSTFSIILPVADERSHVVRARELAAG